MIKWSSIIGDRWRHHKFGECNNDQCKEARLNINEISLALSDLPTIYIRFNPDSYEDKNGNRIKGCFELTQKIGKLKLVKKGGPLKRD